MKSGVFIERDVMLNLATRGGQQKTPFTLEEFYINESVLVPLQRLKSAGFLLLVTTNQPEISRGNLSRRELDWMHTMLRARLPIDDIYVCPHDEADHCPCRKPRPGLLLEASFKWHLELGHCFVIGHRWHDADAAHVVGATSVMIQSPWIGRGHADVVTPDFTAAVEKILELMRPQRKVA
jgi:D-glycero-D-manno-heptose 1,7-bisphosphate phosphatase